MSPEKFFKLVHRVIESVAVGLVVFVLHRTFRPHLNDALANIAEGFFNVPVFENLLAVLRSDDFFFRAQCSNRSKASSSSSSMR
jgi:hypothetical protein